MTDKDKRAAEREALDKQVAQWKRERDRLNEMIACATGNVPPDISARHFDEREAFEAWALDQDVNITRGFHGEYSYMEASYAWRVWQGITAWQARAALAQPAADAGQAPWRDGEPPKPWREEWFIAETIYGDRVVLRSLPEEYTYDYKTADDTYMAARNIKRWMQFPDSEFIAPDAAPAAPQPALTGIVCQGRNCSAIDGDNHSPECLADHYAATGYVPAAQPEMTDEEVAEAWFRITMGGGNPFEKFKVELRAIAARLGRGEDTLFRDMLQALEHVESVYRQNVVKGGEPSGTLENLQRVIAVAKASRLGRAGGEDARDAARYRWLRDEHIGEDPEALDLTPAGNYGLDAAIDAAMAATQQHNGKEGV